MQQRFTNACVWVCGGSQLTNLPLPTQVDLWLTEIFGFLLVSLVLSILNGVESFLKVF